jgi:clan AA aspartic protease
LIHGYFDNVGQPRIAVSIFGNRGEVTIDAVIDMGFNGPLCLPLSLAIPLGLELYGRINYELADGTIKRELTFEATIHLGEAVNRAEIFLTESEDALLGSELLAGYILEIDYSNRTVEIRESPMNSEA